MVGDVDHDRVLVGKASHDLIDDAVVVERGVVILRQDAPLVVVELGSSILVVVGTKLSPSLRVALAVVDVLPHEVEQDEIVGRVGLFQVLVILREQPLVVGESLRVARVKHRLRELRVVQEEATAEIIDRLLGLGEKLVRDETRVVARLAKQFGEERVVAPFPLLSDDVHREEILEDEARQIPRCHDIAEGHQLARLLPFHLPWRGGHEVAILLRVVLAKALADDQYDIGHAVGTPVDVHPVLCLDQFFHLLRGQFVGEDAEGQPVDGLVELCAVVARQLMLYTSDVRLREHDHHLALVVPRRDDTPDDQSQQEGLQPGARLSRHPGGQDQSAYLSLP